MLARVRSGALVGIEAVVVEVEVDMALGLPFFNVVGLPDGAVKESKVRVVSALKNCGFVLPQKRITVNLAPADLKKEGATFELPIAKPTASSCPSRSACWRPAGCSSPTRSRAGSSAESSRSTAR